jgi:hypothetical protein
MAGLRRETINVLNGSTINSSTGRGIELYRAVNLTITGSQVSSNGNDGIYLDNDPALVLQLSNARVNGNNGSGIELHRGAAVTVAAGSQVNNNTGAGIQRIDGSGQATTIDIIGSDISTNQINVDLVENGGLTITDSTVNNASNYGVWLRRSRRGNHQLPPVGLPEQLGRHNLRVEKHERFRQHNLDGGALALRAVGRRRHEHLHRECGDGRRQRVRQLRHPRGQPPGLLDEQQRQRHQPPL